MHIFKKLLICVFITLVTVSMSLSAAAESRLLAFPGAEGGGKYSLGARGILDEGGSIEVYHVTNLADSGAGSLRDAVSKPGRIVVFDVSGTIDITTEIKINNGNLTLLGQTAPGDGVTVLGAEVQVTSNAKDVIVRHMRFRPTDRSGGILDSIGGDGSNVIFDHLSASWSTDEGLTLYEGENLTIQNTIGSESLKMSTHSKGAHGYGAIWGGTNASYVYNLLAHHDSRNPRMHRNLKNTDVESNIIYNWGQTNSSYGAEPCYGDVKLGSDLNWVNNNYKAGPGTARKIYTRIFDASDAKPAAEGDPKTRFYFSGNFMNGALIENYKDNAYVNGYENIEMIDSPFDMGEYKAPKMSAEETYNYVLDNAGATLPRRDPIDARVINDVKNDTGRIINNANEVGGLIPIESITRRFEIPQEWLASNGLSGRNETDIVESGEFAGYTVIEAYVNDWTEEQSKIPPTNPNIIVQSPAISSLDSKIGDYSVNNGEWTVISETEPLHYKATAIAVGGNEVKKMELYSENTKIAEYDGAEIDDKISLTAGTHYLTCRAINTRGEKTQSTTSIVCVKGTAAPGSYSFKEIRDSNYNGYKNKGGATMDEKGYYTIYGSGRITTKSNDNCGFMYKPVSGDFDITVRIESIPKFENQQVNGLMVRTGLNSNDVMAMIGHGHIKYGENSRVFSRASKGAAITESYFKEASGTLCENEDKKAYDVPHYMRIQRNGSALTFSVSKEGKVWNDTKREPMTIEYNSLPDTLYVGLATDSSSGISVKEYFSSARFSHLTLNGESDVESEEGGVPFLDTSFNPSEKPEWIGGSGNTQFINGFYGNYGDAMLFWGDAARNFKPQGRGVITASADFIAEAHENNKSNVNNKAGVRFMLNGVDKNGNPVKIKSIYASIARGFFEDYDDSKNAIPADNIQPLSENKFELNRWYKVEITLNYETGKGTYSFKPYTEYNTITETFKLGESIFDFAFDFDENILIDQLHFQRFAGWTMYLDNVSLSVKQLLYTKDNKLVVDEPSKNANLYIGVYDENGALSQYEIYPVKQGEKTEYNIPSGHSVKAFLWDENNSPLCKPIEL